MYLTIPQSPDLVLGAPVMIHHCLYEVGGCGSDCLYALDGEL